MRICINLLLAVLFLSSGHTFVSAQGTVLSAAEFGRIVGSDPEKAGTARWKQNLPYRMTMTTTSRMEGRPETDWTSRNVHEFAASGAKRSVLESKFGSGPAKTRESIVIGGVTFRREGGNWIKEPTDPAEPAADGPVPVFGAFETVSREAEYKFLGAETIKGAIVKVYWKSEREKRVDKAAGVESVTERTAKYFMSLAGMLVRSENESKTTAGTQVLRTAFTIEWESDPRIAIALP
jgi:hypothetical protein